jgi:hypothetical protein
VVVQVLLKDSPSSTRGRSRTTRRGFKTTRTTTLDYNVLPWKESSGYRKEGSRQTPSRIPLYSYWDSCHVILLELLPCNRLGSRPLDYIKEGRVPSRSYTIPPGITIIAQGAILQTGRRVATPATRTCINLVSCVLARNFGFQIMAIPTFYLAAGTSHGGRVV